MTPGMSLAPAREHVDPWCTNAQAYRGCLRLFSAPVIFCTLRDKMLRTLGYIFVITLHIHYTHCIHSSMQSNCKHLYKTITVWNKTKSQIIKMVRPTNAVIIVVKFVHFEFCISLSILLCLYS